MKSLLIIVLLHFYFASALPTDNDKAKAKEHLMDISTNCRNKEGATEIDVEDIMLNHIIPTTKIGKCFNACMMEQYEIIVDGKFNVDGVITLANLTSDNSEKVNNIVTILANECKSMADSDRCELSLKITQCLDNTAKKRGITDTDFI